MRRKNFQKLFLLSIALIFVISFTLTGCGGASEAAKDSSGAELTKEEKLDKELNIFNWTNYMAQEVIDKFQEEYGVKINYSTYSSNEEMLAKLMAGGTSQYDISIASDYMVEVMLKQKTPLIQAIDMDNIPNFKNIDEKYKNLQFDPGNKYSVPYMCGTVIIAINTDKVTKPIKSYKDLWDPVFKNGLVVLDDQRAIIGMGLKVLGYSFNDTDEEHLEAAKEEVKKLLPNIKAFDSDSPKTLLVNGEAIGGLVWSAEAALAKKENPEIQSVFPEEGMYLWQDNFVIPKDAPHKKTAEAFINYILEPEISAILVNERPYTNPNKAAQQFIDKAVISDPTSYPPAEELEKGEYLRDLGETTKLYDRIWSEIKQN